MSAAERLYRILVKLYPAGFRENYGPLLEREFADDYANSTRRWERVRILCRAAADVAVSAPGQFAAELVQDVRHALKTWRRRPLLISLAAAALAVGLGANIGVFSVVNGLLLRSLPFRDADRLVALHAYSPVGLRTTPAEFDAWRRGSGYFSDGAVFIRSEANLTGVDEAVRVALAETSSNFFELLGVSPKIGRGFSPEEHTPGRNTVAVISYGLWQQLYGGDRSAVGSDVVVNGVRFTIVGVAPPGFDYPGRTAVWTPTVFEFTRVPKTRVVFIQTIARVAETVPLAQAQELFADEAYRHEPDLRDIPSQYRQVGIEPLQHQLAGNARESSLLLMGGVAFILLIACANLANLLIARTSDRATEMHIRAMLGASRARIRRQLLTESLLLSAAGCLAGLVVAQWTAWTVAAAQPAASDAQQYTLIDWRVGLFAAAVTIVTGLGFGIFPALHFRRLGSSRTATGGLAARTLRQALVGAQIALTIVLLTGALALGRGFLSVEGAERGYQTAGVASLSVSLSGSGYADDAVADYYRRAVDRLRQVPGVVDVSWTEFLPLDTNAFMGGQFAIGATGSKVATTLLPVGPGFVRTMGGRVLYGREFSPRDATDPEHPVLVSATFARRFGSAEAAIGQHLAGSNPPRPIIGVVAGMQYTPSRNSDHLQVFLPSDGADYATFVVRLAESTGERLAELRGALQSVDPKIPVFGVNTMDQRLADALALPRFYLTASSLFGLFAVVLAILGVYGVVSYAVIQRTREMGIRLALGTTVSRLRAHLLRDNLPVIAAGAVAGCAGAQALDALLTSSFSFAEPFHWTHAAASIALLATSAALTIWSATRRLKRLDLADVLRAE